MSLLLAGVCGWREWQGHELRQRLQAEADSLRAVTAQRDTLYIQRVDSVDRVVVVWRTHTDSVLIALPPLAPGDTCFGIAAVTRWRDSLRMQIAYERMAADSALRLRDMRIVELQQTVRDYQGRLDAAIAAARPSHGWRTDALLVGVGLVGGVLLRP